MGKKITKVEDLPRWFKVANFSHLAKYGTLEWAFFLEKMLDLVDGLSTGETVKRFRKFAVNADQYTDDQLVDLACLSSLSTRVPDEFIQRSCSPAALKRLRSRKYQFVGVQSINAFHRWAISQNFDPKEVGGCRGKPQADGKYRKVPKEKPFFIQLIGTEDSPGGWHYEKFSGIVAVDMWLPDSILLENFKRWLAATRAMKKQSWLPRTFTSDDYAKWYDDRFAPYCYLRMWAEHFGVSISQPVMVEALFPNRRSVTVDQFRKTKIDNYEKWFRYETLDTLWAQVDSEAIASSEGISEKAEEKHP